MSTEKDKELEVQEKADIEWALGTIQGRRFIWRLLSQCGIYRALEGEPNQMLVQEGTRRVGLFILGITTDVSEDLVFKMMQEAKNRATQEIEDAGRDSATPDPEFNTATGGYDSGPDHDLPAYGSYRALDSFF